MMDLEKKDLGHLLRQARDSFPQSRDRYTGTPMVCTFTLSSSSIPAGKR